MFRLHSKDSFKDSKFSSAAAMLLIHILMTSNDEKMGKQLVTNF
jgi:hypothetical protein